MPAKSNIEKTTKNPSEETVQDLRNQIRQLQSEISELKNRVGEIELKMLKEAGRYIAVCPGCDTRFDIVAHHYSIGLFDNLVYVKCPKCNRALPVKGGVSGEIQVVEE